MSRRGVIGCLLLTVTLTLAQTASVGAAFYALIIGINDYKDEGVSDLQGAVADAEDIAGAVQRLDTQRIIMLRDGEATRARITEAWEALLQQADRGDTLVLTYAGHGSQEPDTDPIDESDGYDENFVLGDFTPVPEAPGHGERLRDDALNKWFKAANKKGVRVIFIADSCHSGTMTRGPRGPHQPVVRAIAPYGAPAFGQPPAEQVEAGDAEPPDNVIFFSATQEDRTMPEVMIAQQRRGALSYAFARALEGAADSDADGVLVQQELVSYLVRAVRQYSEAQQTPDVAFRAPEEPIVVLDAESRPDPARRDRDDLVLHIAHAGKVDTAGLKASLQGVQIAAKPEAADLIWDAKKRRVFNDMGDPVAEDVDITLLSGVAAKWRFLPRLKQRVLENPLDIALSPSDARHRAGAVIRFEVDRLPYPYLTIFNLASEGTVQFLYPLPGDRERFDPGAPWRLDLRVRPPFGADHLVMIASAEPLRTLHRRITTGHIDTLPDMLDTALANTEHSIGLHGLYTTKGAD